MSVDILFRSGDLVSGLAHEIERLRQEVMNWNPDELLATAETDVVEFLVNEYSVECPVLHRDQIVQLPVTEVVDKMQGWNGQEYERRRTRFTLVVPFDGEKDVFKLRASQFTTNNPHAVVQEGELHLEWVGDATADQDAVHRDLKDQLDKIERHLTWAKVDIDQHNQRVAQAAPEVVSNRRAELLAARHLQAGLGYPIRERHAAPVYAAPVRRKTVTPRRPTATGPFKPEPVLPDVQYAAALEVLINARNALERAPSTTAKLTEENIRDMLLVALNGQFEGRAAGEVFNGAGKTDILIREQDRNIFIAECKIWRGAKAMRDALNQLLTYLVWRDTKAALLLFIRRGEPNSIIAKAIAEIENFRTFKRTVASTAGDRYDFVIHANDDPNQEIRLAFLPFALNPTIEPDQKASPRRSS